MEKKTFSFRGNLYELSRRVNSFGESTIKNFVPYGFEDEFAIADHLMLTRHDNGFVRLDIDAIDVDILIIEASTVSLQQTWSLEPSDDKELSAYFYQTLRLPGIIQMIPT
jgi:hypothetical protein